MDEQLREFLEEVRRISFDSANKDMFLDKIGEKLRKFLKADDVIVKDIYKNSRDRTPTDDFLINTGKPYIDNRLSGYSAFGELIKYNNMGFLSCMMLPIKTQTRQFGVLTFLSKIENCFNEKNINEFSFIANSIAQGYDSIVEKNKNLLLARYFDAAFESILPQAVIDKNNRIIKANKELLDIINKNIDNFNGLELTSFFNFGKDIDFFGKLQQINAQRSGTHANFKVYIKKINDELCHVLFYETTEIELQQMKDEIISNASIQLFLLADNNMRVYWTGGNSKIIDGMLIEDLNGKKDL